MAEELEPLPTLRTVLEVRVTLTVELEQTRVEAVTRLSGDSHLY